MAVLETEVKGIKGRGGAAAVAAGAAAAPGGGAPPPAQLRRVREVLAGQEALVQASLQRLSVLEGALGQHAEAAGLAL